MIATNEEVFEQATNYLLTPKAVATKENYNQDNSGYVRIGNLTFTAPGEEIWDEAIDIMNRKSTIITHITLEQRAIYTTDFVRAQSLKVLRECAVRQEHIKITASIANLIRSSSNKDLTTISFLNSWWRTLYAQTSKHCKREIRRLSGKKKPIKIKPFRKRITVKYLDPMLIQSFRTEKKRQKPTPAIQKGKEQR